MEPGTWLWKKKASERTTVTVGKSEFSLKGNQEDKTIHEKFACLLYDCTAKDELVVNHSKAAQEAFAGWEKAEAEAKFRRQERDEALQRKLAEIDKFYAALKDCMQQLLSSAREHDQRVHEAVMKASKELEKKNKKLEEKYEETSRMVANLTFENSQLATALLVKEKLVDDANEKRSRTTGEFNILMARLDTKETENALLKSEFQKLEKELETRNEEMEFNRRSADALEKKHLENVRKINKLEAECRKLRGLVRKQTPASSPDMTKMSTMVEVQAKAPQENPDHDKRISFMNKRISEVEEENKTLKETACSKDEELRALRTAFASVASKLSQIKDQLGNHSGSQQSIELIDGFASRTSDLLSQLENLRVSERENIGVSDTSLRNEFVEKDKLPIVSANPASSVDKEEHFPLVECESINMEHRDLSTENFYDWLQNVLKAISEQTQVSKRSMNRILEDVREALKYTDQLGPTASSITETLTLSGSLNENSSYGMGMENQLKELAQSNERLLLDLENLQESKRLLEEQIQSQKLTNEDLNTQLAASKVQLDEVRQKLSSLEVELDDRRQCCEDLEATCLKLQQQLESFSCKELPRDDQELFHTSWESTAASTQVPDIEETIQNYEKKLKALASAKESTVMDNVLSKTDDMTWSEHASLLDRMIAEDGVTVNFPNTKEIVSTSNEINSPPSQFFGRDQSFYDFNAGVSGALSIVASQKGGGGISLLRKLILRMRKGGSKKKSSSMRYRSIREL